MKIRLILLGILITIVMGCYPDYVHRGYYHCPSTVCFYTGGKSYPQVRVSRDSIRYYRLVVNCDSMEFYDYANLNVQLACWDQYGKHGRNPNYHLPSDPRVKLVTWSIYSPMDGGYGYNTYNYGTMIQNNDSATVNQNNYR